jgi:uncharacterized membrane protein (UPF0136 family)
MLGPIVFATHSIITFTILVLVGAIIGFKKAGSKASLTAGILSAIAFTYCYWLSFSNPLFAFKLAFVLVGVLEGIFLIRLIKTKKFMPSGVMLILCIIEHSILAFALGVFDLSI